MTQTKMIYPKEYNENLIYRNQILDKMAVDTDFAEMMRVACQKDILFWINTFCWLRETNKRKKRTGKIPFITYKFQDKFIYDITNSIEKCKDLIVEKSRDMGVTYSILVVFFWYWLFGETGNDFLVGSINTAKTDSLGAIDSLFPKLRLQLYSQPPYFIPQKFQRHVHDGFMKLVNPETENLIRGDSNKYFATSGRYKAILFDEFAKWQKGEDQLGWQSASDSSPCKIAVSSANGRNNLFYDLRSGTAGDIKLVRLHWKDHPLKNQRWADREKRRRTPSDYAAEVEIDFLASIGSRAAENFDYSTHVRDDVRCNGNLPIELNCDFNINPMGWVLSQTIKNVRYTFREYVEESSRTEILIQKVINDYKYHNKKTAILYGDATGKYGRTSSRYSDWEIIRFTLERNQWEVIDRVPLSNPPHIDRINTANKRLKDYEKENKSWEIISKTCPRLIDSIESTERNENQIVKNGREHLFDAFSYGLCNDYPVIPRMIYQIKRGQKPNQLYLR